MWTPGPPCPARGGGPNHHPKCRKFPDQPHHQERACGMSAILFRRFLANPMKVAYMLPSSKALVKRVLDKMDFSAARVVVEFGAGEGCFTRELATRLGPEARLLVYELDPHLADHLREQFADDDRVQIFAEDAAGFRNALRDLGTLGSGGADCVISGIPLSYLEPKKKKALLHAVHEDLAPGGRFIAYQVTPELKVHTRMFAEYKMEYFLPNLPPMFIQVCRKAPARERIADTPGKSRVA